MISEGMQKKAKRNTEKLLSLPIKDIELFNKIKKLPFFHIDKEHSLDNILIEGRIYSSYYLPDKYPNRGNTYPTDANVGLNTYTFLSCATVFEGSPYGDILMEFDSSIVDIPNSYFTPKDISCYEKLWNNIAFYPSTPLEQFRSNYIEQFYELHAIYHYIYHFIVRKYKANFDKFLEAIFNRKIHPPEIKIYHSLSLDYLKKLYLPYELKYAPYKKYKNKIDIVSSNAYLSKTAHKILKNIFTEEQLDSFEIEKFILIS